MITLSHHYNIHRILEGRGRRGLHTQGACVSWLRLLSQNNTQARGLATAKSLQSCLTLCDPIDGSPLGSPVPGILQARTLEWVAISFSNAGK